MHISWVLSNLYLRLLFNKLKSNWFRTFWDIFKCTHNIARDILSNLISTNIIDTDNFNWISQLRYYWKYDDIGMVSHNFIPYHLQISIYCISLNKNFSFLFSSFIVQKKRTSYRYACFGRTYDTAWNIWEIFYDSSLHHKRIVALGGPISLLFLVKMKLFSQWAVCKLRLFNGFKQFPVWPFAHEIFFWTNILLNNFLLFLLLGNHFNKNVQAEASWER